jgi:arylsulfatase A-like enzyme
VSQPNIILIVLDTVRYDAFSESLSNGSMPRLASFIDEFNIFDNCIAPSPWTVPSHVSLFTGLYPSEHNVHEDTNHKQSTILMNKVLNFEGNVLPESLKEFGYTTYGFVANPNLMPGTGFERGFDYLLFSDMFSEINDVYYAFRRTIEKKYPDSYKDILKLANNFSYRELLYFSKKPSNAIKMPYLIYNYIKYSHSIKISGFPLMKGGKNIVNIVGNSSFKEPFFMFLNFMEAHDPYVLANGELFSGEARKMLRYLGGDSNIGKSQLSHFKELYRSEISLLDTFLGKIMDFLIKTKYYDESLIVITSDHGQNFGEEHYYGHGILLSDSLVRIPLMIKLPWQRKYEGQSGYQSLVNVYQFLLNSGKGVISPELLTSDHVFAESFGIQEDYREMFRKDHEMIEKLSEFDKRRLVVYKNSHKFSFNINDSVASADRNSAVAGEISNILIGFLGQKYKIKGFDEKLSIV